MPSKPAQTPQGSKKPQPKPAPKPAVKPQPKPTAKPANAKPLLPSAPAKLWLGPPRSRQEPLWLGETIPIIGLTGKPMAGKTLFAMEICPNDTLCCDPELSGATYYKKRGIKEYLNVPDLVAQAMKRFTPLNYYAWLLEYIKKLPKYNPASDAGFRVIMFENMAILEEGILAAVKADPKRYGVRGNQAETNLIFGPVKALERTLLLDLAGKCETLVFTTHLAKEWVNNQPTRNMNPKGKDVLMELPTIYLRLSRDSYLHPGTKERVVPEKPLAVLAYKMRLEFSERDEAGEMHTKPLLPPTILDCTPAKIRAYIARGGVDYSALTAEEQQIDLSALSADDKLELQASIEANRVKVAELELERAQMDSRLADARESLRQRHQEEAASEDSEAVITTTETEEASDEGETENATAPETTGSEEGDDSPEAASESEVEGGDAESLVEFPPNSLGANGDDASIRILLALRQYNLDNDADYTEEHFQNSLRKRGVERVEDLEPSVASKFIVALKEAMDIDDEKMDELLREYFPDDYPS